MIRFTDSENAPLLDVECITVLGLDDDERIHFSEQASSKAELHQALARAEVTPNVDYVRIDISRKD